MLCLTFSVLLTAYVFIRWATGFAYRNHLTRKRPRRYKSTSNGGWF